MKKTDPKLITDNMIEAIGSEWMLITAGSENDFNTMTASWGGIGFLWNKPVVYVFVRPERHTFGFMEREESFTLSFLGGENRRALSFCGSHSGRDTDKIAATGLVPEKTDGGNIYFRQARLVLECRKLYAQNLDAERFVDKQSLEKWYGDHGNMHKMYIAEITSCLTR